MCEIHVTNDSAVYNVEFICNSNITGSLSFDVVKTLDKTKIIVKNPNCIEGIRMNVNIPKEVTDLYVKSVSGPVNVKHTAYDNMNVEFNVRNANAKMELNNFESVRLASINMNGGNIHSRYAGTRMGAYICQIKADVTAGDIIVS